MSLSDKERLEIESVFKSLAGMVEGLTLRLEQIERLLALRLKSKLMVVSGKDDGRDAAELLAGIREGVQIETILLDIGGRLHDLEYHCFASDTDKEAVRQLVAGLSETGQDGAEVAGDSSPEDDSGDTGESEEVADATTPEAGTEPAL